MARVEDLMEKSVRSCRGDASLNEAARIMWERDCGFVPVLASDDTGRVVGVITDRDVCMAAYTRGTSLLEPTVASAMSAEPRTCAPTDSLASALAVMRAGRVRRLPVVDAAGQLLGVVSLADLARACTARSGVGPAELSELVNAVSEPRARSNA